MGKKDDTRTKGGKSGKPATMPPAPPEAGPPRESLPFPFNERKLPKDISVAAMRSGDFPYDEKMDRDDYDDAILPLQIELLKLHAHLRRSGQKLSIVFEGRDGAGKGGNISRFTQHLNPRHARVVALSKPTETEQGQWYFQRYAQHMPTKGEIVFFDRSWYNRAGVERVMGFAKPDAVARFLDEAPTFERLLVEDGVLLVKFFITIGREMQLKRLHKRFNDPLKQWKLSPIDYEAPAKWDAYSAAFDEMLARTDSDHAPWTIVRANCKMRARLATIRHVLAAIPYPGRENVDLGKDDPGIAVSAKTFLAHGGEE